MPQVKAGKKFDLDLDFGLSVERRICSLIERMGHLCEVKADRKAGQTGNLVFEIRCRGKPSGLAATSSHFWAQAIVDEHGFIQSVLLVPTAALKARIKRLYKQGKVRRVVGGDDKASEMLLVSLRDAEALLHD